MDIPGDQAPLSYLAHTLPPRPEDVTGEDVLDRFLGYVEHLGLELYAAQQEAILELSSDKNLILATPTGSGKSLVGTFAHFLAFARQERTFYTAPIKALVNEKFFSLCHEFGPVNVGMLSGDAAVNADAPILCCTQEILAQMALREGDQLDVGHVVIDEFHYYADRDRGVAWQIPLLALPQATFLLMSATFGDAQFFESELGRVTRRETAVVRSSERPVPLDFEYRETPLHETIADLIKEGRWPIYVVHFTQRACAEGAQDLLSVDFISKEKKKVIGEALRQVRFDSPYGKDLRRILAHGVGIHHAGLLPKYRLVVEKLAQRGLLAVIVGTDTLGVGVNIPIRTVLFTQLCKFDGQRATALRARDFHQIAGRAGRRGFDTQGSVVAQAPEHVIENLRLMAKAGDDPKKQRKLAQSKKKPPTRGYVHWDRSSFERLVQAPPEPLVSQFRVNHGMLIQVLQRPEGGCRAALRLLRACHENDRSKRQLAQLGRQMVSSLIDAEIIQTQGPGRVTVHADLQEDFSLTRALSLYLVEVVRVLDPESETYALDVLSMVEAILENPEIVLRKQLDKLKGEKVAELKAAGVEYEERMAQLEEMTYPKPNAELIYETFNLFARRHPWVGEENIHPKSVARDMIEKVMGFGETIREYGLERSEGVLLRYLSDVYKTFKKNVPDTAKTASTDDVEIFLEAVVHGTDNSLVREWEALLVPRSAEDQEEPSVATVADRVDVTADPRTFGVLVRNAVFTLVRALANRDWPAAAEMLQNATGNQLEQALVAYFDEYGAIAVTPTARAARFYQPKPPEGDAIMVDQVLCWDPVLPAESDETPEPGTDWVLRVRVDLPASRLAGKPQLSLVHLGT